MSQPIASPIDYLRISVTDRCNLRCMYCMPRQGVALVAQEEILTFEEIICLAEILVNLGIKKIRITGGEPLVRKGIIDLVRALVNIRGVEEVTLTTNGVLLSDFAQGLKDAGLKRINISLDTLNEEKFALITGSSDLAKVFSGISAAKLSGFSRLKLNVVAMRGINDDEILDFVEFSQQQGLILRFIEFMDITPLWNKDYFLPIEEVKGICAKEFRLTESKEILGAGPAQYYLTAEGNFIGFIKTQSANCRICSRLRLTSTGELKICLYEHHGILLKQLLKQGFSKEEMSQIIRMKLGLKRDINYSVWKNNKVYMSCLGG